MWQLFVGPLLQLDIDGGVEGARVGGLSGGKVDVLDDVSGHSLPQLLLKYGLPERRTSAQTSITHQVSNTSCSPDKLEYVFMFACACVCVCARVGLIYHQGQLIFHRFLFALFDYGMSMRATPTRREKRPEAIHHRIDPRA